MDHSLPTLRKRRSFAMTLEGDHHPLKRSRSSLANTAMSEMNLTRVTPLSTAASFTQRSAIKRKGQATFAQPPNKRQKTTLVETLANVVDDAEETALGVKIVDGDGILTGASKAIAVSANRVQSPPAASTTARDESDVAVEEASGDQHLENSAAGSFCEQQPEGDTPQLEEEFELICEIHPTVDPVYIREQLMLCINDPDRISTVTFAIYEATADDLPTRENRQALIALQEERAKLDTMQLDTDAFLQRYADPLHRFNVKDTEVTELYYDHAEVFLKNEFRDVTIASIKHILQRNGFHLTPAYHTLITYREAYGNRKRNKKSSMVKHRAFPRSTNYEYPDEPDEQFYWERLFLLNQQQILDHIEAEKAAYQARYNKAKLVGNLHNCAICLKTDIFAEDMASCSSSKHLFCHECVRLSTLEILSQGRSAFPCLDLSCDCQFLLSTLELVLDKRTMSLVTRRVQAQQLKQANIVDLVSCPSCPFAVIIPEGHSSSVFHCENPECMQDSCRWCQSVAHTPYTCKQFERLCEVDFAHFLQNQMSEAMIRQCPKCDQRFIKEEGCNMMTCSNCRFQMCYICRTPLTDGYAHFRKNNCQAITDMTRLHEDEAKKAFHDAAEQFRAQHSHFRNIHFSKQTHNQLITTLSGK